MEVCSKRRWGQPEFTLLTDPGAGNNRSYLYKGIWFFTLNMEAFQKTIFGNLKQFAFTIPSTSRRVPR